MASKKLVPLVMVLILIVIVVWQFVEHDQNVKDGRSRLEHRARDIANTLAVVIRSQRFFGGVIFQPRLETALWDLVQSEELESIVLFNAFGDIVASAGNALKWDIEYLSERKEIWDERSVVFVNFVDLGIDPRSDWQRLPTIILQDDDRDLLQKMRPRPPRRDNREWGRDRASQDRMEESTSVDHQPASEDTGPPPGPPPEFQRPPNLNEEEYQLLIQRAGMHGFVIEMSTEPLRHLIQNDLWKMISVVGFASIAFLGFGYAWRNTVKSSELQLRLVKANEMNTYLREMNLAAAGLAHETRNPLNLVRGLAQVIEKDPSVEATIRNQAMQITEEVDRVTAQLNEFINYSRPCEPKPVPVDLPSVLRDVEQTLVSDLEDKTIQLRIAVPNVTIEADERMLRQVFFNLLFNSIQAVEEGGAISIEGGFQKDGELVLTVRDDGPGIPPDLQDKIFHPYFTTRASGTGLGLSIVKQIVAAHGWTIEYVHQTNAGAIFRLSGLKVIQKGKYE